MLCELKTIEQIKEENKDLFSKILDNERYINVEYCNYFDETLNYVGIEDVLKENGLSMEIEEIDLYYRSYTFNYDFEDKEKFIKMLKEDYKEEYNEAYKIAIEIIKEDIENSCYCRDLTDEEIEEEALKVLDDELEYNIGCEYNDQRFYDFKECICKFIDELSEQLYKEINDYYEGDISDEMVFETLKINEYVFDSTGKMVFPFKE
jgi:hypothetical protein